MNCFLWLKLSHHWLDIQDGGSVDSVKLCDDEPSGFAADDSADRATQPIWSFASLREDAHIGPGLVGCQCRQFGEPVAKETLFLADRTPARHG